VALTANAVAGMREMYLDSGFDDYLAKPVDPARLDACLTRWIPEPKRGPPPPQDGWLWSAGEEAFPEAAKDAGAGAEEAGPGAGQGSKGGGREAGISLRLSALRTALGSRDYGQVDLELARLRAVASDARLTLAIDGIADDILVADFGKALDALDALEAQDALDAQDTLDASADREGGPGGPG
jgi:CheY-like chemotaxis protein